MPHRTQYGTSGINLEVGTAPGWVGLVRSAAAHVGAAAALSVTDIDDLRLAADESFATMLQGAGPDEAVQVQLTWALGSVQMSLERRGAPMPEGDDLTFLLLRSLVQDADLTTDGDVTRLTWTYRAGVLA